MRPSRTPLRLLAGIAPDRPPLTLDEHHRVHGPRPRCDPRGALRPGALIDAVRSVRLRGRGGAGFPLATKLSAVARRRGRPVVVVNGAESEPASRKDATLLGHTPHLVLDGAVLAAEAVGAGELVVWLHEDRGRAVWNAVQERAAAGVDGVPIRVERGPRHYVAGHASALVNHLSGRSARPSLGPHATERGVHARPTLVSNAETLAQLALLARHGPHWYASAGDAEEPGTLLVTLAGGVYRHLVAEVPFGTPIGYVLDAAEPVERPQAVLVGGYAGGWLPWPYAARVPLTVRALRAAGGTLGVGLLAALPASRCGLVETAHLAGWLADQTAGQCGPCVNGLPAIAGAMRDLADGPADIHTVDQVVRWAGMVTGRGLCGHPDGAAVLIRSALATFREEVSAHLHGWCTARDRRPLLPVPTQHDPLDRP